MQLTDVILEGIEVHGLDLLAYAVTVGEAFNELPSYDAGALPNWESLVQSNEWLAKRVLGDIKVEYVPTDPYKSITALINDVLLNHHLSVFKTPENTHPGMSAGQNDLFRALHDAVSHAGGNSKQFFAHLAKNQSGETYKPLWGRSFSVRGEMEAYLIHAKLLPGAAIPALYTEVVGQICYYFITGSYAVNKVAIINGVDFKSLGTCYGDLKNRFEELQVLVKEPDFIIQTTINDISLPKNAIKWGLLQGHK